MSKVRGFAERAALVSNADATAHRAIKMKARKYASFSRYEAEDLYQATLQAALEGNPKWRANETLINYCDAVMATKVNYHLPPTRRSRRDRR